MVQGLGGNMGDKSEVLEAVLQGAVDLENIPIEKVFENLRCNSEGLTDDAAEERLAVFGLNKLEVKKEIQSSIIKTIVTTK